MNLNKNFANNYQPPSDYKDQKKNTNLNKKFANNLNANLVSNSNPNLNSKLVTQTKQPLYFVNLDNYLHHQFLNNENNKLHLNQFFNQNQKNNQQLNLVNPEDNQWQQLSKKTNNLQTKEFESKELINSPTDLATESTASKCLSCFDQLTKFIERSLNRQPVYNLIKCFIVFLTIVQFCIFLLSVITYKNNEQAHFYPKHGDYFILGTNLANLNALLSTIFYLYSIICEVWPLLILMTTLQAFYSIIELLALLIEPIKVQYIYIVFVMLTSLQTFSMLLFVVMLKIKKLQERKSTNSIV